MRSLRPVSPFSSLSRKLHDHRLAVGAVARRGLLGVATLAMLLLLGLSGVTPVAAQDRPPGGVLTSPVVRAIDLASPAVVRIATLYSAHLRLSACGATVSLPASGAYTIGGLGSGAFVSANGDILTADHVVDIDRASLDNAIFAGERVSSDVAAFLNAACHPSAPITADDVANGIVQFNGLPFSTTYSAPQVLVWRSASYFGVVSSDSSKDVTTQLAGLMRAPYNEAKVLTTSAFEQDDVALIHVGLTDTPSIQLDPSSALAVEDALTVIGFPGNGDVNGDPTNLLTPSVNNVNVSAIKRNDNGSQLIQVGGNVEHGDSGGPALDAAGHIVGIVSFGGPDIQGITAFLRSSDSALTLIRNAGIDTTPGAFQKMWEHAFAAYADTKPGHWQTASREMDTLSSRYPDFHGLDVYRSYADTAAVHDTPNTSALQTLPLPLPLPILAAIAGAVILLLLLLIIVSIVRSRARRRARQQAQQAALASQPVWSPAGVSQGYPGYNGQNGSTGATGYGGYNGYSGYSGYSGYNGSSYAPSPYNVPAQPTRPANGQPQPSGYPQPYPSAPATPAASLQAPAAATPYAPTSPTSAPQYPGYPLPSPQGRPSAPSSTPSSVPTSQPGAAMPPAPAYVSRPASSSSPLSAPAQGSASTDNAASAFCVNGHPMQPGAPRCLVCGAERARHPYGAAGEISAPPWGQSR